MALHKCLTDEYRVNDKAAMEKYYFHRSNLLIKNSPKRFGYSQSLLLRSGLIDKLLNLRIGLLLGDRITLHNQTT